MFWARASSISFFTFGTLARQRGRTPQLFFPKSRTSSAVVFGSTVTELSSGAGGGVTLAHSAVMSPASADAAASAAIAANSAVAHVVPRCFIASSLFFLTASPDHDAAESLWLQAQR